MSVNIPALERPFPDRSSVQSLGIGFSALTIGAVFGADLLAPLGTGVPFLYVLIIWMCTWWASPRQTIVIAVLCLGLSILGLYLSPGGALWYGITNRSITFITICLATYFGLSYQRVIARAYKREREVSDFLETAPLGIKWIAPDGMILWANQEEIEMLGYSRDEYVGHPIRDFFNGPQIADQLLAEAGTNNVLKEHEAKMRCRDGSIRHVSISANAYSEGGKMVRIRCFTRDVTARKQAEEETSRLNKELEQRVRLRTTALENEIKVRERIEEDLRRQHAAERRAREALFESEKKLRLIMEHTSDMVTVLDNEGRWVYGNPACDRLFGETRHLNRTDAIEQVHVDDRDHVRTKFVEALKSRAGVQTRYRVVDSGGGTRTVESEMDGIRDAAGWTSAVIVVGRDITDRLKAEEDLREREELLRITFDSAPVGINMVGLDLKFLRANAAYQKMLGYTEEELRKTSPAGITHEADRSRNLHLRKELLDGKRGSFGLEKRYITKSGGTIWVHNTVSMVRDESGNPRFTVAVVEDITERKEAEIALQRNYEILDRIFDTTHFCIVYLDREFKFIRVNRAYADACGHSPEFFIGKSHFALYPGEEVEAIFRRVVDTGEPYTTHARPFEFPDHPEWGVTYWDWTLHPLRNADDAVEGLLFALVNVTERERAERDARGFGHRLQLAARAGHIGFWERELATGKSYFSPEWKRQLGFGNDEIVGRYEEWEGRLHPHDRERVISHLTDCIEGRQTDYQIEYRLRHKDGRYRWIHARGDVLRDASGAAERIVGCHVDVTEFKRTQEELEAKTRLAQLLETLASTANEALTAEGALRASLERICNYGGWMLAHVVTISDGANPDGVIRQWISSRSGDMGGFATFMEYSETKEHLVEPGMFLGAMFREQRPIWLPDLASVEGYRRLKMARALGLRAAFCFPVISQGRIVAFLEFFSDDVREVDQLLLGAVGGISGQLSRAIERSHSERAVARLAAIVANSSDAIVSRSVDHRILTWNAAAERLFGYSAAEVIGRDISLLLPPEAEARTAVNRRMLDAGRLVLPYDTVRLAKDGQRIAVSVTPSPIRDASGNLMGVSLAIRDIRERVRADRRRAMEHTVARVLANHDGTEGAMPLLIRAICETMGWSYGAYWVWSDAKQALRRAAWWADFSPEFDAADENSWLEFAGVNPGGLLSRARDEVEPVWIRDLAGEAAFRRLPSALRFGFKSACSFPILDTGKVAGAMEFFTRDTHDADAMLSDSLRAIGAQIGQFIQRKRAEEAHRASEAMLSATFELAAVGIALLDNDLRAPRWLRVNQKLCDILGYTREELLQMSSRDVTVPEDRAVAARHKERLLRSDVGSFSREKRYVRKDGRIIWANISVSVVRGADGHPTHVISVLEDISERKQSELERTRLATIVENSTDAIVSRDLEYRVLTWNVAAERLFGYNWAEVVGRDALFLVPPDKLGTALQNRRLLEGGDLAPPYDTVRLAKGGQPIDVSVALSPIRDTAGKLIGTSLVLRDIRERVRWERYRAMEHEVMKSLAESASVAEGIRKIIRILSDTLGWCYGAYWIREEDSARLHCAEWWADFTVDFDAMRDLHWIGSGPNSAREVLLDALRDLDPIWISDVRETPAFHDRLDALSPDLVSGCLFSIVIERQVVGVLEFFGRHPQHPESMLLEIMGGISGRIGRFIRQKQAEEAVRASEAMLNAMFELAAVGIGLLDNNPREPRWLRVNQKLCEILGYNREELLGMNARDMTLPEDRLAATIYKDKLLRAAENYTREKRYLRKDGKIIWVNISVSAVRGPDGHPTHVISVVQDVSGRKQAEVERAQLAAIVESSNDAIFSRLPDGTLLSWNRAAERLYGWTAEEIIGREVPTIVPPECREALQPYVRLALDGHNVIPVETTHLHKDGRHIPVQITLSPVMNADGTVVAISNTVRDVSDQKRNEQELRAYSARLRRLSLRLREAEERERRAISRELHDRIGPEISTLSLMLGLLEVNLSPQSAKVVGAQLKDMRDLMKSVARNVRDVMAELRPAALDDYGLLAALRHFATEFSKRTGIAVNINGAEVLPRLPGSTEIAMFRIVQEAFNNISKHSRARHVDINVHATPERLMVEVADDGVGFEPAQRRDDQATWGLAIMHERAEAADIELRVDSSPGAGAIVILEAGRAGA